MESNVVGLTSKKLCEKESQSFSHCGSFDDPDLQLLNDYTFLFFFVLRLQFFRISGHEICSMEVIFKTFPTVYYKPYIPKLSLGKPKNKTNM
jgi:hypothetical protein